MSVGDIAPCATSTDWFSLSNLMQGALGSVLAGFIGGAFVGWTVWSANKGVAKQIKAAIEERAALVENDRDDKARIAAADISFLMTTWVSVHLKLNDLPWPHPGHLQDTLVARSAIIAQSTRIALVDPTLNVAVTKATSFMYAWSLSDDVLVSASDGQDSQARDASFVLLCQFLGPTANALVAFAGRGTFTVPTPSPDLIASLITKHPSIAALLQAPVES